jgi:hypothetical protein
MARRGSDGSEPATKDSAIYWQKPGFGLFYSLVGCRTRIRRGRVIQDAAGCFRRWTGGRFRRSTPSSSSRRRGRESAIEGREDSTMTDGQNIAYMPNREQQQQQEPKIEAESSTASEKSGKRRKVQCRSNATPCLHSASGNNGMKQQALAANKPRSCVFPAS